MTLPSKVKRKANRRSNDVQESAADEFRKKALQQAIIDDLHVAKYSNGGRLPQGKMEDVLKGLLEIGCPQN
jgi:hypothetical protein